MTKLEGWKEVTVYLNGAAVLCEELKRNDLVMAIEAIRKQVLKAWKAEGKHESDGD